MMAAMYTAAIICYNILIIQKERVLLCRLMEKISDFLERS